MLPTQRIFLLFTQDIIEPHKVALGIVFLRLRPLTLLLQRGPVDEAIVVYFLLYHIGRHEASRIDGERPLRLLLEENAAVLLLQLLLAQVLQRRPAVLQRQRIVLLRLLLLLLHGVAALPAATVQLLDVDSLHGLLLLLVGRSVQVKAGRRVAVAQYCIASGAFDVWVGQQGGSSFLAAVVVASEEPAV